MKNILYIDITSDDELIANVDNDENSLFLYVSADSSQNPVINIGGTDVDIIADEFIYEIPANYYIGTGQLEIIAAGVTYYIDKIEAIQNGLYLSESDDEKHFTLSTLIENDVFTTPDELDDAKSEVLQLAIDYTDEVHNSAPIWRNITLEDNVTYYSSNASAKYAKHGQLFCIRGTLTPTGTIKSSSTTVKIGSIPEEYAPSYNNIYQVCHGSSNYKFIITVNTSGEIFISRYGTTEAYVDIPAGAWLPFNITYII